MKMQSSEGENTDRQKWQNYILDFVPKFELQIYRRVYMKNIDTVEAHYSEQYKKKKNLFATESVHYIRVHYNELQLYFIVILTLFI
jgi:hypothetical protein